MAVNPARFRNILSCEEVTLEKSTFTIIICLQLNQEIQANFPSRKCSIVKDQEWHDYAHFLGKTDGSREQLSNFA